MLRLARHHYDLTATEFRDALALRYHMALIEMPGSCDGCGDQFTIICAVDCWKGGLVIKDHNKVTDALGDITALEHSEVLMESSVRQANDKNRTTALVVDLGYCGMWQLQTVALIDIRVIDSDAPSIY